MFDKYRQIIIIYIYIICFDLRVRRQLSIHMKIISDYAQPRKALQINPQWRGKMIPLFPIHRNYFILSEKKYDMKKLKKDVETLEKNILGWESKTTAAAAARNRMADRERAPLDISNNHLWTAVTLKGYLGQPQPFLEIHELKRGDDNIYKYTDKISHCPYIKKILEELNTDIYLVRLLKLNKGKHLDFHVDGCVFHNTENIIRCAIPIITHPNVHFQLGYPLHTKTGTTMQRWLGTAAVLHQKHLMPGRLWFTNVNTIHRVDNKSNVDRIHLVVDLRPTAEMMKKIYGRNIR